MQPLSDVHRSIAEENEHPHSEAGARNHRTRNRALQETRYLV
jgi:hypothetical protein